MSASSFEAMVEIVKRRERATKQVKPCPSCGTVQVQLVSWFEEYPQFKCRRCAERWAGSKSLNVRG